MASPEPDPAERDHAPTSGTASLGSLAADRRTPSAQDPGAQERGRAAEGAHTADTSAQEALVAAVTETEAHVSAHGWDAPVRVFSLVRTAEALEHDPGLGRLLPAQELARSRRDPQALTVIEQEDLPAAADLEDLLGQLAWPESVHGAVLSVERTVLSPQAQARVEAVADPQERTALVGSLADREDIRMVVGVLRSGESWCALRSRSHDSDGDVYRGERLVPQLVEALAATFL
ncbi:PPA1309 family protein [Actinomyces wuliandei]|uniref:PPA1309 family protein n=1 Tax=Actinomyces wuliandei TaxID=2057743 RepID=UPI001FAAF0DE|nr:PPA1309 family protein [Actinomyces wuliandei]